MNNATTRNRLFALLALCVLAFAANAQTYTFDTVELGFFSSPKLGGGSVSQGYLRYRWSDTASSSVGFTYAAESFNAVFADPDITDSLLLVVNNLYRLDLVPYERQFGRSRISAGLNTSIESIYEYGFFATTAGSDFGEDVIAFEQDVTRVFLSPRAGIHTRYAGSFLDVQGSLWVAPLILALSSEYYMYRSGADRDQFEEEVSGIGFGYPEIEVDFAATFADLFQIELNSTYRSFLLEELLFDPATAETADDFTLIDTEYDSLRLLAVASMPFTLPNESRFRIGGGVSLFAERNRTDDLVRLEPGATFLFGVEP